MSGSSSRKRDLIIAACTLIAVVAIVVTVIYKTAGREPSPGPSADSGGSAIEQAAPQSGPLEIVKAIWQVRGRADFDATKKIAAMVQNGGLHVQVHWEALGLPKAPQGTTATLVLTYRLNGVEQTRSIQGGGTMLDIGEMAPGASIGGNLKIVHAVWQVKDQPDVDVTEKLSGMVKDGRLQARVGAAALGIPGPPPGVTGTLVLVYNVNGTEATRSVRGGGTNLTIVAPPASPSTTQASVDAGPATMPATAPAVADDVRKVTN